MSNPLIILGAGASFDYIDSSVIEDLGLVRPPLTDQLVNPKYLDPEISVDYSDVEDLLSVVLPIVNSVDRTTKKSLEECLFDVKDQNQLIALSFYLKDLFLKISSHLYNFNHYKALKDKILKSKYGGACVVSFNYDTLFDSSIITNKQYEDQGLDAYIAGNIKLIKLHGSCDWSYIKRRSETDGENKISDFEYLKNNRSTINLIGTGLQHDVRIAKHDPENKFHHFPAIAIPTTNTKKFICPDSHIDILRRALNETNQILIVGWKGGDPYLLKMMEENIMKPVSIALVSGSREDIQDIKGRLTGIKNATFTIEQPGFGSFIKGKESSMFFE